MISIGSKIKNIRMGLGLTVDSLSQELGVSRSYLTLIENGERRLPKKLVGKLAKAFRLPKSTVYDWYLEQGLREAGVTDKKSHELIKKVLMMTPKERESLLRVLKEHKTGQGQSAGQDRKTRYKRTKKKLKQYQLIVESAPDAIFYKDLKSHYIFANKRTLEVFGLPKEKVIGKNDFEITPNKEEAGINVEDDRIVFKTGKPKEIIKHMTGADGKEYWFEAIKVPQFDDKGKVIGLIGIARDITLRKRTEEALGSKGA